MEKKRKYLNQLSPHDHISFQILVITKPLDLISNYSQMEKCSHLYD